MCHAAKYLLLGVVRFAFEDDLKATAREWCHLSWCTTVMLAPPGYAKMKTVRKGPEGEDHEKAVMEAQLSVSDSPPPWKVEIISKGQRYELALIIFIFVFPHMKMK